MRKNKKPAIASEWRENKAAQDRAEQQAERERLRADRSRRFARVSAFFKHLLTSTGWVVAIVLAVLLALALATYAPGDPGFSATGTERAQNLCGILGAWISDFLYWLFGRSAWWIVAALLASGIRLVRILWARSESAGPRIHPWAVTLGMAVLMTASVGLECLQFGYLGGGLPLGAGGLYGQYVAGWVTPYLGVWGATFVSLVCVAIGMAFVFGFSWFDVAERIGTVRDGSEYRAGYVEGLGKLFRDIKDRSYPIVIDAANGAASSYVGPLFSEWSGGVTFMANDPDGTNINKNVGVTHIETLAAKVCETGAALGIAYDGDTDRVLMCDGKGRVLDGDIMLWVIGRWLASRGELGAGVVATVMSNMVLEDLLAQEGIKVFRCPVGDRYVLDTMKREGARIGGEQSGHIIALDYANTGDGLCSGILFLKAVGELGEDVSTLVDRFDRYPQVLRNMKVKDKNAVMSSPLVDAAAKEAERLLAGKGRMLLRPSGTEPLIRIFAESRDAELMNRAADIMEEAIGKVVNAQ